MPFGLIPQRQVVGDTTGHGAAADSGQHLLLRQIVQVTPHRGRRDPQEVGGALNTQLAIGRKKLEQIVQPPVSAHGVSTRSSLATSAAIASRPAAPYRLGSTMR